MERETDMKIAPLLGGIILVMLLGLTAGSLPAQETIRVAIPLFPTAAFPVLVASDRGFFQKEGLVVEPIPNQQRADHLPGADFPVMFMQPWARLRACSPAIRKERMYLRRSLG